MSRTILLKTTHSLGIEAAKRRITDRFDSATDSWIGTVGSATMTWIGDTAHLKARALAQTVTGTIAVAEHEITIAIGLPLIIAPFGGAIEAFLKSNADALRP